MSDGSAEGDPLVPGGKETCTGFRSGVASSLAAPLVVRSGCFVSSFADGRTVEGVEIALGWTGMVEAPAGCGTVLLDVKAAGVGEGFVNFANGMVVFSGGVNCDSVGAKSSDGRDWCFEMEASAFVDAVVGVGRAGECRAASCIDFAINRFNKSTESKGRGGIACSFKVFPLWKES